MRQELVQTQQPPKAQRQPDVAEVPQPLETNTLEFDQNRLIVGRVVVVRRIKQRRLRPGSAIQSVTELSPAILLALFQFAEVGHHPVSRALRCADRFDQSPVGVSLAILASLQSLEKHRVLAVELRSLYNKGDTRTCQSNQVGRDYTASRTPPPRQGHPGRDSDRKKSQKRSELFNLG